MVLLHWTRWQLELKNRKSSNDISSLASGQWPDFKIFAQKCSTNGPQPKLLKWLRLAEPKWWPELKIEKKTKRHLLRSQCPDFKVISQKCSSYGPLPKLLRKVLLGWTKWPHISSLASGLISKIFYRNVPLIPLYQNCSALLNKMVTRVKNKKKHKKHLNDISVASGKISK